MPQEPLSIEWLNNPSPPLKFFVAGDKLLKLYVSFCQNFAIKILALYIFQRNCCLMKLSFLFHLSVQSHFSVTYRIPYPTLSYLQFTGTILRHSPTCQNRPSNKKMQKGQKEIKIFFSLLGGIWNVDLLDTKLKWRPLDHGILLCRLILTNYLPALIRSGIFFYSKIIPLEEVGVISHSTKLFFKV